MTALHTVDGLVLEARWDGPADADMAVVFCHPAGDGAVGPRQIRGGLPFVGESLEQADDLCEGSVGDSGRRLEVGEGETLEPGIVLDPP